MKYTIESYKVRKKPLFLVAVEYEDCYGVHDFDNNREACEFCTQLKDHGYEYSYDLMIPDEVVRLYKED